MGARAVAVAVVVTGVSHGPAHCSSVSRMPQAQTVLSKSPQPTKLVIEESPSCVGVRHLQVGLLFLCMLVAYIIRVNMSVAIVAMTTYSNKTIPGASTVEKYHWDSYTKGLVLSAFFWGYLVMNIPAAIIGHSVNNKWLLGCSFTLTSLLAVLTPRIVAWGDYPCIVAVRVCQGLSQGFMMPMVHGLLSKWAPPQERARFNTYILGGLNFGTMIVLSCSGLLASSPWGWPSIFYISGGLGLCWSTLWLFLGANSPEAHPFISRVEKEFIMKSLPMAARDNVKMRIPWKDILTSGAVWGTTLAHVGQNWGIWTILTEIPTYFHKALDFDLSNGGFLTAFPFLLMWLVSFPLSILADKLIIKGYTSVTMSRKIFNSIAHWGGSLALLGLALSGRNTDLAVTLYTITITINCCIYMGFNVNHLDLSPNFARILMGITNGTANITAIIAPLFVGFIIKDESDPQDWKIVFFCSALAFFLGNTAFITLGSGELQPWNDPYYRTNQGLTYSTDKNTKLRYDDSKSIELPYQSKI